MNDNKTRKGVSFAEIGGSILKGINPTGRRLLSGIGTRVMQRWYKYKSFPKKTGH